MAQSPEARQVSPVPDWLGALAGDPAVIARSFAPAAASAAVAVLGENVTAWAVAWVAELNADLLAEIPNGFTVSGHEGAAFEASILAMLTALVTQQPFVTPEESVRQVRWATRHGMSLDAVLRIIWRSHAEVQSGLIDIVTAAVGGDRLGGEVKRLSAVLLEVVATLIRDLSSVFEQESAAWGRERAAVIRRVVDRIVETGEQPADAEELLGIRLSDHHLAAVVCPAAAGADPRWRSDVARWVETVRDCLGATTVLVIPRTDGSTETVWSRAVLPAPGELEALRDVAPPADVMIAFGVAAGGVAGLRQAVVAARRVVAALRSTSRSGVWTYDDHGVLALLMNDPVACRDFVQRTLAGLLGGEGKTRAMRATLLAYLEHEGSRNLAAQQLYIAPTTVAYRVRQAQERLDPQVGRSRVGLMAALALAEQWPELAD